MKPKVGLTLFTSSFMILFTIVVLPALSRPLEAVSSWRIIIISAGDLTASESASPYLST